MSTNPITSSGAVSLLDTGAAPALTPNLLPPPTANAKPELRSFLDVTGLRNAVYGRTLEAINSLEPQTDGRYTLRLRDARYIDPETVSGKRRKQALLRRETLARRIKGTWELEDAETGKKQAVEKVIARVPVISNLGTILHNGNDYVIRNQQRLRSGMYVRRQENGEIEAHANIAPGKGPTHHYTFDPDKGIFRIRMNQANIPLFPLLKLMGATDRQLSDAWGNEIYYNNAKVKDTGAIKKIQERLLRGADATEGDEGTVREKLLNAFANMEMDDEVNKRTLGRPHKGITLDTLMDTTKKLIKLSRGEVDPDSRDSLVNQSIYTPDDFFVERITKDHGKIRRDLFRKIVREQNLEKIPAGVLTEQLENAFLGSGLGQAMEEINTLEILDKLSSVTRMGEGSIGNVDSIPDEARNVQPSQYNYVDPVRTPESLRAGVDGFLAVNARRGSDQKLYTQFKNLKTGEVEYKNPQEVENSVLAFPGVLNSKTNYVPAMKGGKIRYVPKSQVEYVPVNMEGTFSPIGNLVPFKSGTKPQRMAMASRMLTQALPLAAPEAPFVQAGIPGEPGKSYEERYANYMGAVRAEQGGKVLKIADGTMTVRYDDGSTGEIDVVENTPFNRKTSLSQYPMVQPGDRFEPNQLLVKSNFTNDSGEAALGLNARVAYWPYQGYNFEDAIVVSESFAKRATSEHVYQHDVDVDNKTKVGKNAYVSLFPRKFNNETLKKIDKNGLVQVGTEVHKGDPLILAATERDNPQNKIHKKKQAGFNDGAVLWEHDEPGVVTDVEWGKNGPTVIVKSKQQLKEADKLSGRYGDKGIVAKILPDHLMPIGEDGKAYEVLLSPDSIPTRTNPSQMLEAFLGKIVERTGQPYKVADFEDKEDLIEFAREELKKHGLKDQDTILWPERNKKIPNVYTGNRFFMKLMHTAEDKNTGRSSGAYTMDDAPAKGGSASSKRVSLLDMNALLSHGAVANIRDSGIIRGQRNEDLWLQFMQGYNPTQVKVPKAYEKFVHQLQASGINVVPKGGQLQIMAVTNDDVEQWSGGRTITNGDTVDFVKGAMPVKGGLFDPQLTGGHDGRRWSKISLAEPMPNPVMEEPIRRLLGLTKNQYMEVIAGERELGNYGTGTSAIQEALSAINVTKEIATATQHMNHGTKARRDEAIRKLKYLQGAERTGLHPKDWMLKAAPVLPPIFRPVSMMGGTKVPLISDANFLYKDLITANENYVQAKKELGSKHSGAERVNLYNAFKAVTGLGDPVSTKSQEKKVTGILKSVFGSSPKYGCYDDETEILTEDGWVPFPLLNEHTRVATLNPDTSEFEWQMTDDIYHWDYNGEMIWFGTKTGLDCVVTPNHRNWVRYRSSHYNQDGLDDNWQIEPAYVTAANTTRKWFRTAAAGWRGHSDRPVFLPELCRLVDFAAFVGWWAAEGWVAGDHGDIVYLSQSLTANAHKCQEVDRVVSSLGFDFTYGEYEYVGFTGKPGRHKQWRIKSKALADWLQEHVGFGDPSKNLSRFVKDWDYPYLEALFLGYLNGDGTRRYLPRVNNGGVTHRNASRLLDSHQNYHSTSTKLAGDMQEISCKLGVTARLRLIPREESNYKPIWRCNLSGSRCIVLEGNDKQEIIRYTGQVHCVSVPNGIVYVRRHGKPFFSGNSIQRRLLSTTVDNVGRAVISPNPDLDMDHVGLPEDRAYDVYAKFVARRLRRRGMPLTVALQEIKDRTPRAKEALLEEMQQRPVYINRAPVLHKFGIMAFWPKLAKGNALQVSPLIVKGFNADFDGDTMQYHVPSTEEAVREAVERMMPSRNLISPKDFKKPVHTLGQQYLAGLYSATAKGESKRKHTFATVQDAIKAYEDGIIEADDEVKILK